MGINYSVITIINAFMGISNVLIPMLDFKSHSWVVFSIMGFKLLQ